MQYNIVIHPKKEHIRYFFLGENGNIWERFIQLCHIHMRKSFLCGRLTAKYSIFRTK